MSATSRIAVAVSGGYLIGRTRKLKFAIMIGGAITGRRYPTSVAGLVRMGARYVNASPELDRLKGVVRDRLLVAGRDAAIAVAGYQLEALTQRMTVQIERLEEADKLQVSPSAAVVIDSAGPTAVIDAVPQPDARASEVAQPDGASVEAVDAYAGEDWTVEPVTVAVLDDTADQQPPRLEQRPGASSSVLDRATEGATA